MRAMFQEGRYARHGSLAASLALALSLSVAAVGAHAQQAASAPAQAPAAQQQGQAPGTAPFTLPEADKQAIKNYTLNDDVFNRLIAATKEARADKIKPQSAPPDPAKVHTLDDLANQAMSSDPRILPLIKKHGFTPREFMLANLALINAAMAAQAKSNPNLAGQIDQTKINQANVAFFEAHQAQLAALSQPSGGG